MSSNYLKSFCFFIVFFMSTGAGMAQETGSFNTSIEFMNEQRTLSFYVPEDYNPEESYRLVIGLHGMGDNSTNFRNVLVQHGQWNVLFPKSILVFPDGGSDQGRDFYFPEGDEMIIIEALNYAKENYNIDEDDVLLQGFSLGGRSALKFGLENHELFRGLLLNTPAIQGIAEADNHPTMGIGFELENATEIPIAFIVGAEDFTYVSIVDIFYNNLLEYNAIAKQWVIQSMGHVIPPNSIMSLCRDFIYEPMSFDYEAEITSVNFYIDRCSKTATPLIGVRNLGSNPITSIELEIEINEDETKHFTFNTNLDSYEYQLVDFPELEGYLNTNLVSASISQINSGDNELEKTNIINTEFHIQSESLNLPLSEGFDSEDFPPQDWVLEPSGHWFTFMRDTDVKKSGESSIFMFNTILAFANMGYSEKLYLPLVDLSSAPDPRLYFDIAFNYHLYTPPYTEANFELTDTLEILISPDCGETFISIYKKYGDELATASNPIVNPLSLDATWFSPNENEWRTEEIYLNDFDDWDNALIVINYISGMGGSINIDNLIVDGLVSVNEGQLAESTISVYPNPANEVINIVSEEVLAKIEIVDINSKVILSAEGSVKSIATSNLAVGAYFIKFYSANGTITSKKFLIER